MPSSDESNGIGKRPRGRPRTYKRITVRFIPRPSLDIYKLAHVLHAVRAQELARQAARAAKPGTEEAGQ